MMTSSPFLLLLLPFLSLVSFVPFPTVVSQSVVPLSNFTTTSPNICPGLTEFNSKDNDIPQPATFLDLTFQCVYDTDNPGQAFTYSWVPPTSSIRIQPGDRVAFFSSPPNVYRVQSFRDDQVFLVQAEWDGSGTSGGDDDDDDDGSSLSPLPSPPPTFALTVTFPPEQLRRLRISGTTAGGANVVIASGFTQLNELNATLGEGGLDAILSHTGGALSVRLRGEAYGGVRLQVDNNNTNNNSTGEDDNDDTVNAGLVLDIENGAADIYIQGTILTGTVNAIDSPVRSGKVFLDGTILDSIIATGEGPGMLFSTDCTNVIGNCSTLLDDGTWDGPDVTDTCQFGPGCVTQSVSTVNTDDAGGPLLSCSNLNVFECAAPTETPSMAPIDVMPPNMPESAVPTLPSGAPSSWRRVILMRADVGVTFWAAIIISLLAVIPIP